MKKTVKILRLDSRFENVDSFSKYTDKDKNVFELFMQLEGAVRKTRPKQKYDYYCFYLRISLKSKISPFFAMITFTHKETGVSFRFFDTLITKVETRGKFLNEQMNEKMYFDIYLGANLHDLGVEVGRYYIDIYPFRESISKNPYKIFCDTLIKNAIIPFKGDVMIKKSGGKKDLITITMVNPEIINSGIQDFIYVADQDKFMETIFSKTQIKDLESGKYTKTSILKQLQDFVDKQIEKLKPSTDGFKIIELKKRTSESIRNVFETNVLLKSLKMYYEKEIKSIYNNIHTTKELKQNIRVNQYGTPFMYNGQYNPEFVKHFCIKNNLDTDTLIDRIPNEETWNTLVEIYIELQNSDKKFQLQSPIQRVETIITKVVEKIYKT